jgi:hypothetical protein
MVMARDFWFQALDLQAVTSLVPFTARSVPFVGRADDHAARS